MVTREGMAYIERIAWAATQGIVGAEHAQPGGELYDGIVRGLVGLCDEAHAAGVAAAMIQTSLVDDLVKVVG